MVLGKGFRRNHGVLVCRLGDEHATASMSGGDGESRSVSGLVRDVLLESLLDTAHAFLLNHALLSAASLGSGAIWKVGGSSCSFPTKAGLALGC